MQPINEIQWGDTYAENDAIFKREFKARGCGWDNPEDTRALGEALRKAHEVVMDREHDAKKKAAREAEKAKALETMFPDKKAATPKPAAPERRCVVCDNVIPPTGKAGRPATKCEAHRAKKKGT